MTSRKFGGSWASSPVTGLTEVQVLRVSAQKEFSERQRDREETDSLGEDASERC